jgi:hypothetical protein
VWKVKKGFNAMTARDDLRAVAGKAIADPAFRQKLLDDPEAAVKEAGLDLTAEQMNALMEMDKAQLQKGLLELDKRLTMSCWGHAAVPPEVSETMGTVGRLCSWD